MFAASFYSELSVPRALLWTCPFSSIWAPPRLPSSSAAPAMLSLLTHQCVPLSLIPPEWTQKEHLHLMAGWHHQLSERESEHIPGDSKGQGRLTCCSTWGRRVQRAEWQQFTCLVELLTPQIQERTFDSITCSQPVSPHFPPSHIIFGLR